MSEEETRTTKEKDRKEEDFEPCFDDGLLLLSRNTLHCAEKRAERVKEDNTFTTEKMNSHHHPGCARTEQTL